ncbi:MAG: hypothetical protein ACP5RT_01350 [Candidatus Micrarchaeia archaeon]
MEEIKGQSAIEYLSTYGWAIVVMVVIISALYFLGFTHPGTFAGQECLLPGGFSCTNIYLNPNGLLVINLLQVTPTTINVTAIGCSSRINNTNLQAIYNPPSNQIYIPIGSNYTFSVFCYSGNNIYFGKPGSIFNGYLTINYTTTTGLTQSISGQIIAKVS